MGKGTIQSISNNKIEVEIIHRDKDGNIKDKEVITNGRDNNKCRA
jgi:hypothetical protein